MFSHDGFYTIAMEIRKKIKANKNKAVKRSRELVNNRV